MYFINSVSPDITYLLTGSSAESALELLYSATNSM